MTGPREATRRRCVHAIAAVTVLAVLLVPAGPAQAAPKPVPCTAVGHGKHRCRFWPAGNGITGGAPVQSGIGYRVGYLNRGANWVRCQALGGEMRHGAWRNHWFAWTEANNGRHGWVNAIFAKGGANDGRFRGVPGCGRKHGLAPGTQSGNPTPIPEKPARVPCRASGRGRYTCAFYPPGNGIAGGAPVRSGAGRRVGFLGQGANWIRCQAQGRVTWHRGHFNVWWAWTEADDRRWGWVNAVWARGGDDDQRFGGGVPLCRGRHGRPPHVHKHKPPKPKPKPKHLTGYVALGDSYSAGEGVTPTDPASGSCDRSPNAYPPIVARRLHLRLTSFAACAKAWIPDVELSQLAGLSASTGYVTISAGGNDADFIGVVGRCVIPYLTGPCVNMIRKEIGIIRTTIARELGTLYDEIRARAPHARVAVVGYPHLWGRDCAGQNFVKLIRPADVLDNTTRRVARAHGFRYVDPRRAFTGHSICNQHPYLNGLLTHTPLRSFHPNAAGYRAYARLVEAAFR